MSINPLIKLAIKANSPTDKAQILADKLKLSLETETVKADLLMGWQDDKLALFLPNSGAVFIDFISGRLAHRRQYGGGKNQPLARAIGLSSKKIPHVIDATAGMGRDSFVLASLGCHVQMLERSPIIAELLADALFRASQDETTTEISQRMSILCVNASDYLLNAPKVEVIYLDPMYPEKRKSAAVKKDMQALQLLVGKDTDSDKLLAAALQTATTRVVVKRPKSAPCLSGIQPTSTISSPNTRYDIYSIKAIK